MKRFKYNLTIHHPNGDKDYIGQYDSRKATDAQIRKLQHTAKVNKTVFRYQIDVEQVYKFSERPLSGKRLPD